jgi:hypothetical protein
VLSSPSRYQNVLKGMLIRGLLEARRRNRASEDLVNLVESYITIQVGRATSLLFLNNCQA